MPSDHPKRFFRLSDITARIQAILQPHIGKQFWVKAEISSGRERGGSFYCDLVETDENGKIIAQIRCNIWNRDLYRIRGQFKEHDLDLKLDDGTVVGFQCCLQFSAQYGLSLKVIDADPAFALGELELRKKEILARLKNEGLLEPNKIVPVPLLPQRIGLVSSKGSAACNDVIKTFSSSPFGFRVFLADSIVQGLQTETSVLGALDALERLDLDLVIIARGGGSKTDLSYLDNEAIARRIARYRYPVWTGIGHETDLGILDHVANRYFKTPTAVAEEIVARFVEVKRHLEEAENRFRSTWSYRFEKDREWLEDSKMGLRQGTRKYLDIMRNYLRGYASELSSKVQARMSKERSRVAVSARVIASAPANLLQAARGRLEDRTRRFATSYRRQIADSRRTLADLKRRFRPDRFLARIGQEHRCLCDWRNRYLQRFLDGVRFRRQQFSHYRRRFRLETFITLISAEKAKLEATAATIRAADPATTLKRGYSLVYAGDGKLVKSITQIRIGDGLKTEVVDGRIVSTVHQTVRKQDD